MRLQKQAIVNPNRKHQDFQFLYFYCFNILNTTWFLYFILKIKIYYPFNTHKKCFWNIIVNVLVSPQTDKGSKFPAK